MTREEAIKIIENAKHFAYDDVYTKAFDMAIKALEQEPVLDKIRAKIEELANIEWNRQVGASKGLEVALEIIDEYKAESEDKEIRGDADADSN